MVTLLLLRLLANSIWVKSEINQSNPIAIYDTDKNIFSKFVHNVLEIGKDSYIKRVIALPGDSVKIENGKVFVNDVD